LENTLGLGGQLSNRVEMDLLRFLTG
jgi:hypothetical protein